MMTISYKEAPTHEKIYAVWRLWREHRDMKQREIAKELDVSVDTVWRCLNKIKHGFPHPFESERAFTNWIKDHPRRVFSEEIYWDADRRLWGERGGIFPDLLGKDSDGIPVIVEVKIGEPSRGAVGQILEYAYAYLRTFFPEQSTGRTMKIASEAELRLFIIGTDFSPPVDGICEYLRASGINIRHLCYKYLSYKEG